MPVVITRPHGRPFQSQAAPSASSGTIRVRSMSNIETQSRCFQRLRR
jgi:hypothetical protein